MATIKGARSKKRSGKAREPKDEPLLGNVGHFKGAKSTTVGIGKKKKAVKPRVHGHSHDTQKAAAERFGDSISAVASLDEYKGKEKPNHSMASRIKAQAEEEAGHSMRKQPALEEAAGERFGDSTAAITPIDKKKIRKAHSKSRCYRSLRTEK